MSSDSGATWHQVAVGRLYSPTRTRWPETPHLRLSPAGCELTLFLTEPTAEEASEVATGAVSFAWSMAGQCQCCASGSVRCRGWTPRSSPGRCPKASAASLLATRISDVVLQVTLVDAATGIVKAMRVAAWTPDFAEQVRETLRRQLAIPADHDAAARQVRAMYQHNSQQLAEQTTVRAASAAGPGAS